MGVLTLTDLLIKCMVFTAVFNSISVISRRPFYLKMFFFSSFNQHSPHYSFHASGCFPTTIVETIGCGINPVGMIIIDPWKGYWAEPGIEPATSCSQVPTELWGSASSSDTKIVWLYM